MRKHRSAESVILLTALFLLGAAGLLYNFRTADGGDISVSLSDIMGYGKEEASAVSKQAEANLMYQDVVSTAAEVMPPPEARELLPPVVARP